MEKLNRQAMEEYLEPIRPGYEGKNGYWNRFSLKFIYAPAFDIAPVEGAVSYRFTVTPKDGEGFSLSFNADTPYSPLSPVWDEIPVGNVRLVVEALMADGSATVLFEREFLRDFPFDGPYCEAPRSYSEAVKYAILYVHRMPQVQSWLTQSTPDMSYFLYTYPAKLVSAVINNESMLARMMPQYREECEEICRKCYSFLVSISKGENEPLAFFAPTYYGGLIASANEENFGTTMTMEASKFAEACLNLYKLTDEQEFLDRAVAITRTYGRLQGEDGSFPIKLHWDDGTGVSEAKGLPYPIISLILRFQNEFGIHEFDGMLLKCEAWMKAVPMKTFDLTGQFEDTTIDVESHQNLTHWSAAPYAMYLLGKEDRTAEEFEDAIDLIRFCEDQFVYWDALPSSNGLKSINTPCGYEQYKNEPVKFKGTDEQFRYYSPIDASSANIMLAMARAYEETGDELFYQKAKALADNLVLCQDVWGKIPTIQSGYTTDFWINCQYYTITALLEMERISSMR
ncbi:MAG: hypothetical protein MJY56_05895 [Bacteroidales bacterium]|nr:hypothetical protein [Bacteroidales bacterium]